MSWTGAAITAGMLGSGSSLLARRMGDPDSRPTVELIQWVFPFAAAAIVGESHPWVAKSLSTISKYDIM